MIELELSFIIILKILVRYSIVITQQAQLLIKCRYLMKYNSTVPKNNRDGHMYNCKHIMCGFIKTLDDSIHERVESISQDIMDEIATTKVYLNYYDGGCYIIDVSEKNFGNVSGDGNLNFIDNNILNDTSEDE